MEMDFNNLNLDEAFGADFDEADTDDVVTQVEEVTPDAESVDSPPSQVEQTPAVEPEKPKDWNPDGPGKPSVAIRQAREAERAAVERARQLEAQVQAFQQQQAEVQRQAEEAAFAAKIEDLALFDPDQAALLIQQRQQQSAEAIRAQYETQRLQERSSLSVEYAREAYTDFDTVVQGLMSSPQAQYINWAALDASPNPGKALYEYAKQVQPVDREALKAELLAELKQALTPAKPKAPALLGNLPAAAPNDGDGTLDLDNLTANDFKKHGLSLIDLL